MAGFEFRYREGGGTATVRRLPIGDTETLTHGDMLRYDAGHLGLGARGDNALVGAAIEPVRAAGAQPCMRVIIDADAIYGVEDPHARAKGDHLELRGISGAQRVASSAASALAVVLDSPATEETLVRIAAASHHVVGAKEGLEQLTGGALDAALAREVVRCHRSETGRGPTKAHAFHKGSTVVVVLEDVMTKAERNLLEHGDEGVVGRMRSALQATMRAPLVAAVEELTGANVRAFVSGNELEHDMAVEVFVLDRPVGGQATSIG